MQKKIYINVLLKVNMIVGWHISPNERTIPHDYYKDFIYVNKSMENCDEIYKVKGIAVEFENDDTEESINLNNYIFEVIARDFFKIWKIHPEHFGSPAY